MRLSGYLTFALTSQGYRKRMREGGGERHVSRIHQRVEFFVCFWV